jgi:hypothetical protein
VKTFVKFIRGKGFELVVSTPAEDSE